MIDYVHHQLSFRHHTVVSEMAEQVERATFQRAELKNRCATWFRNLLDRYCTALN